MQGVDAGIDGCGRAQTSEGLLSASEAAALLGLSLKTLEKWRSEGKGPPVIRLGRRVAYSRRAIVQWLESQERGGGKQSAPMNENIKPVTACPYIKDPSRWHVDITFTDPQSGKERRVRRVAPVDKTTREDAVAWGNNERLKIVTDLVRPVAIEARKEEARTEQKIPTLAEVWPEFESAHIVKQKIQTQQSYLYASKYILGTLGGVRLDRIDVASLERLKDAMELDVSSQKIYFAKLEKCLRWAMSKGKMPRALLPKVEFDKPKKKRVPIYSPEDLERVLAAAKDLYERVLLLLCCDGCLRIGECAGLMWSDITSTGKHGTMKICRNVVLGVLQDTTKSGEDGEVPLTPRLAEALRELRAEAHHPTWVLPRRAKRRKPRSQNPRPVAEYSNETSLARVVTEREIEAGLEGHGPHRIRHSRLTHLAERGLPLRALQHLARHASEKTTEKYYLHVDKRRMAAMAIDEIASMTPPPPSDGNGGETDGNRPRIALVA